MNTAAVTGLAGRAREFGSRATLRTRIVAMAGILLIPLLIQGVITLRANQNVEGTAAVVGDQASPATLLLLNIDRDAYQSQLGLERLASALNEEQRTAALAQMEENAAQTGERFAAFQSLSLDLPGEAQLNAEFLELREVWLAESAIAVDLLIQAADARQAAAAAVAINGVSLEQQLAVFEIQQAAMAQLAIQQAAFESMRERIDVLEEQVYEAETAALLDDLQAGTATTSSLIWLTMILGTIGGTLAALVIGRSISSLVHASSRSLEEASMTVEGAVDGLDTVAQTTADSVREVADMAGNVSENICGAMSAVDEFDQSIREISAQAGRASDVAREAAQQAEATNESVAKLGDSSSEIGQVIEVITSIAKQTNLLALNATIEAARAGEAGKGFGVVANEVKELAKQTAAATEQISARVAAIQDDTGASVAAIGAITEVITEISDIQNAIADAVGQQSETTSQIAQQVQQAVDTTQIIAGTVEKVAETAGDTVDGVAASRTAAGSVRQVAGELRQLTGVGA
ncbi:MAG: methyl-accepting chemotaxis protein [Actinomycetota bacterium]